MTLLLLFMCSRKNKTTQNLSLNISSMLFNPEFNRYFVTVRAVRGGQESDLCESAIFSFNTNADSKIKCMFSLYLVEFWNIIYHCKHMQYDLTVLLCIQVIWIFPRLNFFPKMVNFTSSSSTLHICMETRRLWGTSMMIWITLLKQKRYHSLSCPLTCPLTRIGHTKK